MASGGLYFSYLLENELFFELYSQTEQMKGVKLDRVLLTTHPFIIVTGRTLSDVSVSYPPVPKSELHAL